MSKYFITAALIVFISELVKRSDKFGALMAGRPLVTGSTRKNSESKERKRVTKRAVSKY